MAPCSGGIKGQSKYLAQPGEKTEVQWIIQNPIKSGRCQIRLSRGHPDDASSYHSLPIAGHGYDARTGTFDCGDPTKTVEEAKVQIPFDTTCTDCTLQWIYEAPGFGSIFQCADISILMDSKKDSCKGECLNGGVCQDGLCYCAAGYFGEYCQHNGKPNQFYEPVRAEGKPTMMAEKGPVTKSDGGLGFFGWYFLLFFISLVIAGVVSALVYLLCRKDAERVIKKKREEELITGRGRGEVKTHSEGSDYPPNRTRPDANRRMDDSMDKETDVRLNAAGKRDMNNRLYTEDKKSPDAARKNPNSPKKEDRFQKDTESFGMSN